MRIERNTVGRTGINACGDTSGGGAPVPSHVSQKQESPGFSRGERQESALVSPEDGDEPPKKIAQRLQGAIKYLGGTEATKVAVRTRKGDTYLARVDA